MKQLIFNFPSEQIFEAVKKSATNLDLEIKELRANHFLKLISGGGFFSYGNIITVSIDSIERTKSSLKVSSESASSLQLIDWGTNENLETDILNEVKRVLG